MVREMEVYDAVVDRWMDVGTLPDEISGQLFGFKFEGEVHFVSHPQGNLYVLDTDSWTPTLKYEQPPLSSQLIDAKHRTPVLVLPEY